jgi:site-specific recombinase XerD
VLGQWAGQFRSLFDHAAAGGGALWPSERSPRVSLEKISARFAEYRDALGLPDSVSLHSLRHSYITHLIEDGYDPLFVQQQVGHCYASTTALYTNSRELHQTGEKPQAAMSARRSCMFPGTFGMAA